MTSLHVSHLEKQLALLKTESTDTRVPPHTWLPFFCKLAIHGHIPAVDTEFPPKIREFIGALPQTAGGKSKRFFKSNVMLFSQTLFKPSEVYFKLQWRTQHFQIYQTYQEEFSKKRIVQNDAQNIWDIPVLWNRVFGCKHHTASTKRWNALIQNKVEVQCRTWQALTCGLRGGGWWWWQTSTGDTEVAVSPSGREGDEAWLVAGDMTVDPGLILGHSGVDSWDIRLGTTDSKTHNSLLDPETVLLAH